MSQLLPLSLSPFLYSLASQGKTHIHVYSLHIFFSLSWLPNTLLGGAGLSLHSLVSHASVRTLCAVIASHFSELDHCWFVQTIEWNSRNPYYTCDLTFY